MVGMLVSKPAPTQRKNNGGGWPISVRWAMTRRRASVYSSTIAESTTTADEYPVG